MDIKPFKYKKLLPPVCLLLFIISCSSPGKKRPAAGWDMLPVPADSTVRYFATRESDSLGVAFHPFLNTWLSGMLLALKEPVLKDYQGSKFICRFTWLRTKHHPLTVRVEAEGKRAMLFCKVSDGAGGYLPGKIITDTAFLISPHQTAAIRSKLRQASFEDLPTFENDTGKDGAEWIVEVYESGKYHVVARWSPQQKTSFRAIGEYLMGLAPLATETTNDINY